MRIFDSKPALRWAAPVAFLTVVGASGLIATGASANPHLQPRTPEQLLVDVSKAKVDGLAGTITQKADLGIPAIPGAGGSDSSKLTSLLSGNHTLRVWYSGTDKARVEVQANLNETDVIRNGRDVWTWSSSDNTATRRMLSTDKPAAAQRQAPAEAPKTPQDAAQQVLKAIGPTTVVSTQSNDRVAGRSAYELVLRPNDNRSLIESVKIAIDGATHVPLRVQVNASGTTAFQVGYDTVTFGPQDPAQFAFNPPRGAKVTQATTPAHRAPTKAQRDQAQQQSKAAQQATKVVGTGWTSVVVTKLPSDAIAKAGAQVNGYLAKLPTESGTWGSGKLLQGTAVSAVLTNDGRLAVGAVHPDLLYAALAK